MKKIIFLISACLLFLPGILSAQDHKEIIAYFPDWKSAVINPYFIKNIETSGSAEKLTVINYAFAVPGPDSAGNIVVHLLNPYNDYQEAYTSQMSVDGVADNPTQRLKGHFNQIKKLKERHPHLRFVISIGGWTGSTYFSDAALTPETREIFVNSCIETFIKGNLPVSASAGGPGAASGVFDGIDIDWEFPISGGAEGIRNNPDDTNNLTELFALFRKKLDEFRPGLLLTAAIPAGANNFTKFNLAKDQQYLDWYCLMSYDYSGSWDTRTGHHTNLFSNPDLINNDRYDSFDRSIKLLLNEYKVNSNKIVAGTAFYGRGWNKVEPVNNGLYQPGETSFNEAESGFYGYGDLINHAMNYTYHWDQTAMAPYLYSTDKKIFWTLDDSQSMALKSRYADAYNLRGIFFWEITGDDVNGTLVNSIFSRSMPDITIGKYPSAGEPQIKIVVPDKDHIQGSDIIINAECNSSVKKVEFFAGGKSIGYDSKPPFNWAWFNVPSGNHTIKAVALNINGKTKSSSVKISVKRK